MANRRTSLRSEEGAELKRLYKDLESAIRKVNLVLRSGMASEAFINADHEVTRIIQRIKKIHSPIGPLKVRPKRTLGMERRIILLI
jgi:hypothetical protein